MLGTYQYYYQPIRDIKCTFFVELSFKSRYLRYTTEELFVTFDICEGRYFVPEICHSDL